MVTHNLLKARVKSLMIQIHSTLDYIVVTGLLALAVVVALRRRLITDLDRRERIRMRAAAWSLLR
jgi:hypothetical protein